MGNGFTRGRFLAAALVLGVGLTLGAACTRTLGKAGARSALRAKPLWKAGVAKIKITPAKSVWMTGYGARTKPSEGILQELYAKALALEDQKGNRAVLVTSDLLGFSAEVARNISGRVEKQYGLSRDRLMLTSSHTHGGPALHSSLRFLYGPRTTPEQWRDVGDYTRELESKVIEVVGAALQDLQPARLSFGHGKANFAINRRQKTQKGYSIGLNPGGPVDHDVPVLRVDSEQGSLRGVVFGYACHNTTLGGNIYQFHGDYAGFAQEWLEREHPSAVAFFVEGCAGDANPNPRGTVKLARQHGETLGAGVDKAMGSPLKPLRGPLRSAFEVVPLPFATPPSRDDLQAELQNKDIFLQWHAKEMLKILDRDGRLPTEYPYPLQVWQFGRDLTLIAMAGEVVVDYALRLKKELGEDKVWVAGYSNDVFAYIPSRRVLEEGGYEGGGAMIYYVQPGPFAPSVEETIVKKAHELVKRVRAK